MFFLGLFLLGRWRFLLFSLTLTFWHGSNGERVGSMRRAACSRLRAPCREKRAQSGPLLGWIGGGRCCVKSHYRRCYLISEGLRSSRRFTWSPQVRSRSRCSESAESLWQLTVTFFYFFSVIEALIGEFTPAHTLKHPLLFLAATQPISSNERSHISDESDTLMWAHALPLIPLCL